MSFPETRFLLPTARLLDYYTAKYAAADGALLWEQRYNGPANNDDTMSQVSPYAGKLALTADGGAVVTGQSSNGSDFDYATVRYAPPSAPTVTFPSYAGLMATSVTLGGVVTSDGGATITARGVVYAKTALNPNPQLGGADVTEADDAAQTTGAFSESVSGLAPHTGYSSAAFATNIAGTTYTAPALTFTTPNTAPTAPDGTATGTTGDQQTVTVAFPAMDADGDAVAITGASGTGLTVDAFTGTSVTFTPLSTFKGDGSFTYTVGDGFGGTATGTITVTVMDNDAPVVATHADVGPIVATHAAGIVVNYEAATAMDNVTASPAIGYSQASGTTFSLGTTTVTITATDAAGNVGTGTFTVTVKLIDPATEVLFAKGSAVPSAGMDGSGIAAGAVFVSFGIPAIGDSRAVAFLANWTVPKNGAVPVGDGDLCGESCSARGEGGR